MAKIVYLADRLPDLDDVRLRRFSLNISSNHRARFLTSSFASERNAMTTNPITTAFPKSTPRGLSKQPNLSKNGIMRCEKRVASSIIRAADWALSSPVPSSRLTARKHVSTGDEIEMICPLSQYSKERTCEDQVWTP